MCKDLSWARTTSYQPRFELKGAVEPKKETKVVASKRSIKASKNISRKRNKLTAKAVGFKDSLSQLCCEVDQGISGVRRMTPAEKRAMRHAENRIALRYR